MRAQLEPALKGPDFSRAGPNPSKRFHQGALCPEAVLPYLGKAGFTGAFGTTGTLPTGSAA